MNKWRLLLLSIFALLHITTSERNFIDGRYGCCDYTQRYSPSDTRLDTYDSYRERQYLPEIRKLNTFDKYSTAEGRDTKVTIVTRRSQIEYQRQRSLDNNLLSNENRRVIAKQRTSLLRTIPEVIRGRQITRERINERRYNLRTSLTQERFAEQLDKQVRSDEQLTLLARKDNRKIEIVENRNLFEIRHVRHFDNSHDVTRIIRENRIEGNSRKFENDCNTRLAMTRKEREDYSREREFSTLVLRSNIKYGDRVASKENKERNNGHLSVRNIDQASLIQNRERSSRVDNREKNDVRNTLDSGSEALCQLTSSRQQRDYSEIKHKRHTFSKAQIQPRDLDRNLEITKMDRRQRQRVSEVQNDRLRDLDRNLEISKMDRRQRQRVLIVQNERLHDLDRNLEITRMDRRQRQRVSEVQKYQLRDLDRNLEITRMDRRQRQRVSVVQNDRLHDLDRNLEITRMDRRQRQRVSEVQNDQLRDLDRNLEITRMDRRQRQRVSVVQNDQLRDLDRNLEITRMDRRQRQRVSEVQNDQLSDLDRNLEIPRMDRRQRVSEVQKYRLRDLDRNLEITRMDRRQRQRVSEVQNDQLSDLDRNLEIPRMDRRQRVSEVQKYRLRDLDRNLEITRMDRRHRQRDSEDSVRCARDNDKIQFNRRNFNLRINTERTFREIRKRSLSEEVSSNRDARVERRRNIDKENSREYMERRDGINTRVSRLSYNILSERQDIRELNGNNLVIQKYNLQRSNARDNKITEIRRNSPLDENRVRMISRRSVENQPTINFNYALIRMTSRNGEVFDISPEIRERRNSRESRKVNLRDEHANEEIGRVDVRRVTNTDINNDNKQGRFEAEYGLRIRQDHNRMSLRIRKNVLTEQRGVENVRVVDNESRQILRRSINEDRSTIRREDTRYSRDGRRNTKNTEERRINIRPINTLLNVRRFSRIELTDNQRSNRQKHINTLNDTFDAKWQCLFYIVQAVYLFSLFMKIPKNNEGTKKQMRITNSFTPAEFLKID